MKSCILKTENLLPFFQRYDKVLQNAQMEAGLRGFMQGKQNDRRDYIENGTAAV